MQVQQRRSTDPGLQITQDTATRLADLTTNPFKGAPLPKLREVRCGEVTDWSAFTRADFREAHAGLVS